MGKNFILNLVYFIGSIFGAGLIALNIGYNRIGFASFLIASVIGLYLIIKHHSSVSVAWHKQWALILVGVYYIIMNIVGIIRYQS